MLECWLLACLGCSFPWWMKPVDGCWIRIWCNGYAQKLLWIFFRLGYFIDFLEFWTAIFGKNPKKANFQPFTLLFVLRLGYNSWVRLLRTWGNDWHGAVPRAVCVKGFFKFGESPKMGVDPWKPSKNFRSGMYLHDRPFLTFFQSLAVIRAAVYEFQRWNYWNFKTRFFSAFLGAVGP